MAKYIPLLLLGLVIRLIIASATFHPDVKILDHVSAIVLKEHNLNLYDFGKQIQVNDPLKMVYGFEVPDDLPLQYWIQIPINLLVRPFVNSDFEGSFLVDSSRTLGSMALLTHLLLIKLPLLVFDIGTGLALLYLVSPNKRKLALTIWLFNPINLWATSAIGQVDVIPTCFLVLSLVFVKQGKNALGVFALGVGAAIKSFPLLLLPFILILERDWNQRIKLAVIGLLPYLLTVAPYLGSAGFKTNALFAPQLGKMLYAQILLSGGESLMLSVVGLIVLYGFYQQKSRNYHDLLNYSATSLLLILTLTHFHPQWLLWLVPLYIVLYIEQRLTGLNWMIAGLLASWIGMICLFDSSLQVRLLSPIIPSLNTAVGLAEVLSSDKLFFYRNLVASVFAGCSIPIIIKLLKNEQI